MIIAGDESINLFVRLTHPVLRSWKQNVNLYFGMTCLDRKTLENTRMETNLYSGCLARFHEDPLTTYKADVWPVFVKALAANICHALANKSKV